MGKAGTAVAFLAALVCTSASPVMAQEHDWRELSATRDIDGIRSLDVSVTWAVGELRIFPAASGLLYDTKARYDARRIKLDRDWSASGRQGRLRIDVTSRSDSDDFKLGDIDEQDFGFLGLGLSSDVPVSLVAEVGAAKAELELGGVPLEKLVYRTGASETRLRWSEPNPAELGQLDLAAGAADFEASQLGNARFRHMRFEGAVGDVTLDFRGSWDRDATAVLRMGLGSLRLVVPEGLGVRIRKDGFLAKVDAPDFTESDGVWTSPEWSTAERHLEIDVEAALGSIEVERTR